MGTRLLRRLDVDAVRFSRVMCLARGSISLPRRGESAADLGIVRGDIREPDRYMEALEEADTVIHLAAATGKASRREHFDVNLHGTRQLVAACERAGVRRFIHVSSIAARFADIGGYPYAESKRAAEDVVRRSSLQWWIVRPTIVLGPDSPIWRRLKALAGGALVLVPGGGRVRVQPIWVDDLADELVRLAGRGAAPRAPIPPGRVLELGGAETLTLNDLLSRIHRSIRGTEPRLVHLPLSAPLAILGLVERIAPSLLPFQRGQFASFVQDGTARPDFAGPSDPAGRHGVDWMLERLLGTSRGTDPAVV